MGALAIVMYCYHLGRVMPSCSYIAIRQGRRHEKLSDPVGANVRHFETQLCDLPENKIF